MASIFDDRTRDRKLKSGMLVSSSGHGVSRYMKYTNEGIEPGWGAYVQTNGNIITSSADDGNQCMATGQHGLRIKDVSPWRYLCHFRGIIYTHRGRLVNPGDMVGNLLCLGSAPEVESGKEGVGTANSRICLILKKSYQRT